MRQPGGEEARGFARRAEPWLEWADGIVYALVALFLLGAAVVMAAYSVYIFLAHLTDDFPLRLITFINDLLLVLIILEVLGTVRSYLANGATSLQPFLYIGIISATRRILAIGAETTLGGNESEAAFRRLMIDLGINGAIVLALAAALYLFSRRQPSASHAPAQDAERATGGRYR